MSGTLDGRVAIVTGAGRGIGREHALLLAREGAAVVVNDLGADSDGAGASSATANEVVEEICGFGGHAIANPGDVASWSGARQLVQQAIDEFGELHVLVNNAGVLRDKLLVSMTEDDWDTAVRVNLKGHFCPTRHAAEYWRERSKAGEPVAASLVHTSSGSGLLGNVGQANYGAAKAGVASFARIAAMELDRYGVRSNVVAPAARTRLTLQTPGVQEQVAPPGDAAAFDEWDPANVSPVVAYLAAADCPITGHIFRVLGGKVTVMRGWEFGPTLTRDRRWTIDELAQELPRVVESADQ